MGNKLSSKLAKVIADRMDDDSSLLMRTLYRHKCEIHGRRKVGNMCVECDLQLVQTGGIETWNEVRKEREQKRLAARASRYKRSAIYMTVFGLSFLSLGVFIVMKQDTLLWMVLWSVYYMGMGGWHLRLANFYRKLYYKSIIDIMSGDE